MTRATFDALGFTRDLVQARIIAKLFAQKVRGFALKGGMAMRVGHEKWARATKDIDLDADQDLSVSAIQQVVRKAILSATQDGLLKDVKISEPKQTETTERWKISGLDERTGQTLHLTVEVSRREHIDPSDTREALYGPDNGEWVTVYRDESLAFKKVKALMADTREAPRDIADLYLLIQADVEPPIEKLRAFMKMGGVLEIRHMWAKLDRMDNAMFRAEVLPSLPPSPDGQILFQDWESIRLTVGENLERWIKMARGEEVSPNEPEGNRHIICGRKHL